LERGRQLVPDDAICINFGTSKSGTGAWGIETLEKWLLNHFSVIADCDLWFFQFLLLLLHQNT